MKNTLLYKITIAILIITFAICTAVFSGDISQNRFDADPLQRSIIQAILMFGIVILGVWYLRKFKDKGHPTYIGVGNAKTAIKYFVFGFSLLILPIILTLVLTDIFGWGKVTYNLDANLKTHIIGIIIALLFEAIPEELVFRGYIYSNLNTQYSRIKSGLISVLLFALSPILFFNIQKYILGIESSINNQDSLSIGFVITLMFLGAFNQYLRILTNSIWAGVGFHLIFIYFNKLIGQESAYLIQLTDFVNETPMQITLMAGLVITFLGLILYPRLKKQKLGWKTINNGNIDNKNF